MSKEDDELDKKTLAALEEFRKAREEERKQDLDNIKQKLE